MFGYRLLAVGLVLMFALSATAPVAAQAPTSYTSPSYGYTVSWDGTWTLERTFASGGYDLLILRSAVSSLIFEGEPGDPDDLSGCLDDRQQDLAEGVDVRDLSVSGEGTIQTGDGIVSGAYRVFRFIQRSGGAERDLTQRIECRGLQPAAALLISSHLTDTASYPAEEGAARSVTASVMLPGQMAVNPQTPTDVPAVIAAVQADLEEYWASEFAARGVAWSPVTYVSFSETIETGCGTAEAGGTGPFYCPGDQTVYVDMPSVERDLLPYGTFVIEFSVAHETGHHVQLQLGLRQCEAIPCEDGYTGLELELMADCLAGSWARNAETRGLLASGDVEQAVIALSVYFGDPPHAAATDPEAHGPGALRSWWFLAGYHEGMDTCLAIDETMAGAPSGS